MNNRLQKQAWILPAIVVAVAAVLRFINADFSFSNDELSALRRLNFNTFGALMNEGVRVDGHPALVHVLLWFWRDWFGDGELVLRLPFILAGIASVWLTFRLGKKWFGRFSALWAAAAMAFLCFPVMYSQVARPYAPGMAFTLLFALRWTIVVQADRFRWADAIGFGWAATLCMYTHYFSGLMAVVIGITGFFFLNKTNRKAFFIGTLIAITLFLPHLPITLHHLSLGGIGGPDGWLGKPDVNFLPEFLMLIFNSSGLVLVGFLGIALGVFIFNPTGKSFNRFHWVGIGWFILPFSVMYFYSVHVNPVLQYSSLLFSIPFVLLVVFSTIPEKGNTGLQRMALLCFLSAGVIHTTVVKNFHGKNHFGVFKELAEAFQNWDEKYGNEQVVKAMNVNHLSYVGHYFDQLNYYPELLRHRVENYDELAHFHDEIRAAKGTFFAFGWSTQTNFAETYALIRQYYPEVIEDRVFFNARVTLFGKGKATPENIMARFSVNHRHACNEIPGDSLSPEGWKSIPEIMYRDTDAVYKGCIEILVDTLGGTPGDFLFYKLRTKRAADTKAVLVCQVMRGEHSIDYHAVDLTVFLRNPDTAGEAAIYRRIHPDWRVGDVVKMYVWHQDGGRAWYSLPQAGIIRDPGLNNREFCF